jgi:1,2-diacylglycerol 3-alpha-glucosyltransferase
MKTNSRDSHFYNNQAIKVFLTCPGLGNINRGFESFTRECFEAISHDNSLDVTLFKGGGESSKNEIILWNLPREKWTTIQISRVVGKITGIKGSYNTEQLSFFLSLLPYLHQYKPDVIFLSDEQLGIFLWHWRRLTKQSYKLLFSNGAPVFPVERLSRWDRIQQLAPMHLEAALNAGIPAYKQSLIPYGFQIESQPKFLTVDEQKALRQKLGLPENQRLIISVGVINKSHKRMDYVIRELAQLTEPRPFLLLIGQEDEESTEVIQLGKTLLGAENFQVRTVPYSAIADYYQAADAFVLASVAEGFGRVFVEALSYGLPCMAHDYEISNFIFGNKEYLADFTKAGSLTSLIPKALAASEVISERESFHRLAYENFSWEKLKPAYIDMIKKCVDK